VLLKGLKELYEAVLLKNGLNDKDISSIYASGMLTSPFGIKEIPHLKVPVGIEDIRDNIYNYHEEAFFKRQIGLIPGVKSNPESELITRDNVFGVNSMRGEEVEIFGVLNYLDADVKKADIAIIIPGSHTQIAYIHNCKIVDLVSTISGELFYSISNHTIISSSIEPNLMDFDEQMVEKAFRILKKYGFNKTVYLINTMKVFEVADNRSKTSFFEGAIFSGDILCLERYLKEKWHHINHVVIYANKTIAAIYRHLLKAADIKLTVDIIEKTKQQDFAVRGFLEIVKGESCHDS